MGVPFRVVHTSLSTATAGNTQDITVSGETRTPVCAYFHVCHATSDDTSTADNSQGWGAADGTNEWAGSIFGEDNETTTSKTYERHNTDCCVSLIFSNSGTTSERARFSFNSFVSGGVRLDIDVAAASAYLIDVLLFFEGDWQVGLHTTSGTVDTQTTETGMGFDPEFLICHEFGNMAESTTIQQGAHCSQGFVADNSTSGTIQAGTIWYEREGSARSDLHGYTSTSRATGWIGVTSGATSLVEYGFTSDGFAATTRTLGQAHYAFYVAGRIDTIDPWAGSLVSPTSSGDHDFTEPNVEAVGGIIAVNGIRTANLNSWVNGGAANPIGTGMWTYTDMVCMSGCSEHNRLTTDDSTYSTDSQLIAYEFATGTVAHLATYVESLTSGGFTVNSTTFNHLPREMPALCFSPKLEYESVDESLGLTEEVGEFFDILFLAVGESLGIAEEINQGWLIAVSEDLGISEEIGGFFDILFLAVNESLGLSEEVNPILLLAVAESLGLVEELGNFVSTALKITGRSIQPSSPGVQEAQGFFPGQQR